jgi:tetratricopeptide (TPR) repeat protein
VDCPPLTRHLLAQSALGAIPGLLRARRGAEAESLANAALVLDPRMAALWVDRAVVRATAGRLEEAVADLERALELDPSRVVALGNLATYQVQLGRIVDAEATAARMRAACNDCLQARILGVAIAIRQGRAAPAALLALDGEAAQKRRKDAWCRAFALAGIPAPSTCGSPP